MPAVVSAWKRPVATQVASTRVQKSQRSWCSALVVLELDDLLAFIGPANESGKQNVAGLEHELHWKLGRAKEK